MKSITLVILLLGINLSGLAQSKHKYYYSIGVKPYFSNDIANSNASMLVGRRLIQIKNRFRLFMQASGDASLVGSSAGLGLRATYFQTEVPRTLYAYLETNALLTSNTLISNNGSAYFTSVGMGWVINKRTFFDMGIGLFSGSKPNVVLRWFKSFGGQSEMKKRNRRFKSKPRKSTQCPSHLVMI